MAINEANYSVTATARDSMSRLGADVTAMDAVARELDGYASRVDRVRSSVDAHLRRTYWIGPDADAFRARWYRIAVGDLGGFSADLAGAAAELRRQAAQQRAASGQRPAFVAGATLGAATLAGGSVLAARTTAVGGLLDGANRGSVRGRLVGWPIVAAGARATTLGGVLGRGAGHVSARVRNAARHGFVSGALLGAGVGLLVGSITAGAAGTVVGAAMGALIGARIGSASSGGAGRPAATAGNGAAAARAGTSSAAISSATTGVTNPAAHAPGASRGTLPGAGRSWADVSSVYAARGEEFGVKAVHQSGGGLDDQCVAWATYRWQEIRAEAGLDLSPTPQEAGWHGGRLAEFFGGQRGVEPTLGAMISYNTGDSYGHVMIVEQVERTADGSMTVSVSEFNVPYGSGQDALGGTARVFTQLDDGKWRSPDGSILTFTVANH